MKALILLAAISIIGINPFAFAEISVYQDLTPEEQESSRKIL
ncbi:MAG: hypothetical protein OEM28_08555 [Nitrosopumilus sp.]|nr:hypothetical protein [Nitrosopumilus sp.]MDH3487900.1 hypothetical protein [Nitrosopumilus sp.]